ncbi:MAG: hypothetical protein ACO1Q7_07300 [Gemmatimonas sp.]
MAIIALTKPQNANAQVDPTGKIRTLQTPHFQIHYPQSLDSIARRSAYVAEDAYSKLSKELAAPRGTIDLLLQDNVDLSNGFAQTTPSNRITIYALPPVALAELRFHDDWLRLVITHELAHIFHIDRARGLWKLGRYVFGRNEALFPNSLLPSWVKEGLAVHYETKLTGSGRIASTESRVVATAAARADDIHGPDAWSSATTRYPRGQTPYAWGSMLMDRQAKFGGDSSMRKFVDGTAYFPIPFLLNRQAKKYFGRTFWGASATLRDSLQRANPALSENDDASWKSIVAGTEGGQWNAEYPRWRNDSVIEWVASNGRDLTSVYRANITDSSRQAHRIARRNSIDVNAVAPNGASVFSQFDYKDPYTLRSDLYRRDSSGDHRLTHNARLIQPDVRASDGAIVALQLTPAGTRIVRVRGDSVTPLTTDNTVEWAEPRWDPLFQTIAAVQILRNGMQRVVLLDTLGYVVRIVAESRSVMSHPTFVSNSVELMWASDRSGRMQLEIADIGQAFTRENLATAPDGVMRYRLQPFIDTLWRAEVRSASNVSTAIYQPSVSPDGLNVAAVVYRNDGFTVVVGPLKRDGETVKDTWYASDRPAPNDDSVFTEPSKAYRPLRQLVPTYWQPVIGEARDGGSSFGASTSGVDILGRHSYAASALLNPREGEWNGAFAYRYSGFGRPVIDVSVSQDWDATFRVTDSTNATLGFLARQLQFATASVGWSFPHVRWSANYSVGAQYERRNFTSDVDSALGPANSVYRTGTRYPALFMSGSIGNLARGARAFSAEQGVSLAGNVSVRKRESVANSESWRGVAVLRGFQPLPLPGYARHVIAARVAGGITDVKSATEFSVGGVSGVQTELIPGINFGDPSRTFPLRGFSPGSQRGMRAIAATAEYRAPLGVLARGLGLLPVFFDKFSFNAFADAARAWCPADRVAALCEASPSRDGWLASAGGELNVDLALQYDVPYRFRMGVAQPFASPSAIARRTAFYVTLGASF